ncbi:MAG: alpha/beta hydrolase [Lachnospiraceae bacterium]|nr:alpha/beta hydrolase [Lachnospiraceae bacterium]
MKERVYETKSGCIHYFVNEFRPGRQTLVMLPGLTADHRLFDKQVEAFEDEYNLFTWDAPGHAASRPFALDFNLPEKAAWLHGILENENLTRPVLIGQSMGGYVSQCFMERYPGECAGFISIDSAPIKRCYVTGAEIWLLKRTEPMYRAFPWKMLQDLGVNGVSKTAYGRSIMRLFVNDYTKDEYCKLSGHGTKMLADAMEADLPYVIDCPAILICGTRDESGSAKSYNKRWAKKEGLPLYWIRDAGHNANTDAPDEVNGIIRKFVKSLGEV